MVANAGRRADPRRAVSACSAWPRRCSSACSPAASGSAPAMLAGIGTASSFVVPAPDGRRTDAGVRARGDGRARRRLLLGRPGRVPARQGRDAGGVRLRGRRAGDGRLRDGQHRHHRARRVGAHHLRPDPGELRPAPAGSTSRSCRTRPNSTGRAPTRARSTGRRSSPRTPTQQRVADAYIAQLTEAGGVPGADRHEGRAGHRVLPRRAVPPGLPELEPDVAPYIAINDMPKVDALKQLFPERVPRRSRCWWSRRARLVRGLRAGRRRGEVHAAVDHLDVGAGDEVGVGASAARSPSRRCGRCRA